MSAMQRLTTELKRLYGSAGEAPGMTRAICLSFRRLPQDGEAGHWERLCAVANAVQSELGLRFAVRMVKDIHQLPDNIAEAVHKSRIRMCQFCQSLLFLCR